MVGLGEAPWWHFGEVIKAEIAPPQAARGAWLDNLRGQADMGDPQLEIRTVPMLREALGEKAQIKLDSNMQWSLTTARWVLREIEPFKSATTRIRLYLRGDGGAAPAFAHTIFNPHPRSQARRRARRPGLSKTLKFIAACEAMGKRFWCYSNDLGIMTSAYLHVVAATPWITEASQSLFRWQIGDVIKDGPIKQTADTVRVPEGRGWASNSTRQQ